MDNETSVESFLIVNVQKWIIDYNARTIEIEGDGYKISEDKFMNLEGNLMNFDTVIANTIQFGKKETLTFNGQYYNFQTENFRIDSMNQETGFYLKFEDNIICHFIFNYYDSDSLININAIYSEYKHSRDYPTDKN